MKKVYLLFVAVILAACSAEPVENEVLSGFDANLEGNKIKSTAALNPMGFYNGSGKLQGTLTLSHDCNFLYVSIFPESGVLDDADLGIFHSEILPRENGTSADLLFDLESEYASGDGWIFPISELPSNSSLNIFVKAWGSWVGEETLGEKNNAPTYTVFNFENLNCDLVCTYGKGHWKNHSNDNPGNQEDLWPVTELVLGNHTYSQSELNEIMDVPNNEGNNLVIFSQHLIAAKLNVANGAGNSEIAGTIEEADFLIGDLRILTDAFSDKQKNSANNLKGLLGSFNESSPCEDKDD